jgi:hypothetical protein
MKTKEARELGNQLSELISGGDIGSALSSLEPVLQQKIPFRIVGLIGEALGAMDHSRLFPFLDRVAATHTQGGWVIIGTSLNQAYAQVPIQVLRRCAGYIGLGDVWYAADILGERVPGPALVTDFQNALPQLEIWRASPNPWVRRAVGVAVHFWAKRSRGETALEGQVSEILALMAPLFQEWEMEAVKGIGWGLKTVGKMYPHLLAGWLPVQVGRPHRAIMLRKALTYLTPEQKEDVLKEYNRRII